MKCYLALQEKTFFECSGISTQVITIAFAEEDLTGNVKEGCHLQMAGKAVAKYIVL